MPSHVTVVKKYVSRKVKCVKWKPSRTAFDVSKIFVSGSWDDEKNLACVWSVPESEGDPHLLHSTIQTSDINDIQYVSYDTLAFGCGDGKVRLYQQSSDNKLEHKHTWNTGHALQGSLPCTALSTNGKQISSVGEDGNLILYNQESQDAIGIIESGGGCPENAVTFVNPNDILTANIQGHLRLWDVRSLSEAKLVLLCPDQVSVNALSRHPTQNHVIAAACDDGTLNMWDLRNTDQPFAIVAAHSSPITDVQFHPNYCSHLFTCGLDGQVLHWDANSGASNITGANRFNKSGLEDPQKVNSWLTPAVGAGAIDTVCIVPSSLFPINSLTVDGNSLVAGSDNEALYFINNVIQ